MKIFIKDDLSFLVKNTENISGEKLTTVLRERGLIFNDIADIDFNYDIRNYENKLRENEVESGDKCSTFYIPGKSTTGINVFFLESERNGFPPMIKVVFPKMCSRHDSEMGINLVEESARFLKSNIIINDEESMAADAFVHVYNNEWIKSFVNSNASDIIQIAQKLDEGEEVIVPGLLRDLYVGKNTLEGLKTGEPENIEERLMLIFIDCSANI
ncbi:MAG TPA: hypothetical protein ENI15_20740 [Spirochaetes bacterium]|nr:hypothetical protein [Spirochaetota bacterium]